MFLAPNGKVFNAGREPTTRTWTHLEAELDCSWAITLWRTHWGSAVMYDDGKVPDHGEFWAILWRSLSSRPTASAEVIDLNAASPSWQYVAPMTYPS